MWSLPNTDVKHVKPHFTEGIFKSATIICITLTPRYLDFFIYKNLNKLHKFPHIIDFSTFKPHFLAHTSQPRFFASFEEGKNFPFVSPLLKTWNNNILHKNIPISATFFCWYSLGEPQNLVISGILKIWA